MNCGNAKEIINNIMDGNIIDECDSSLFKHLADCPDCSHFFNMLADLKREIKNSSEIFPSDLDEKVFDGIREVKISTKRKSSVKLLWKKDFPVPFPIGIAFSMLLIILCIISFNNYYRSPEKGNRNAVATSAIEASEKVIIIYGMPEIIIKDKPFENGTNNVRNNYKLQ